MLADFSASKPREIFRKVALERLSSPDQLDLLTQVVGTKGWLVLGTLAFAVLVATIWGVFGEIPSKVSGQAMLTRAGGVFDVPATAQGRVAELDVDVGDVVKANQVVARIEQPELEYEISSLQSRLAELKVRQASQKGFERRGTELQGELLAARRKQMEEKIRLGVANQKTVEDRIKTEEVLLQQGLITKQTLLNSRIELEQVRQDTETARSQLQQLSLQSLDARKQSDAEAANLGLQIADVERQIGAQKERLALQSVVRSPYGGRILEIKSGRAGALVGLGASLFTLERDAEDGAGPLEAVIFVSAYDGPSVHPGMDVQISPGSVKPEEHGFMLGRVRWVSSYPSSQQGIMQLLQNEKLVSALSGHGPPIKIVADLLADPSTPSGYKWSSGRGPEFQVKSGTLANATITTEKRPPIALVIPALKKFLGV
ncbi:MAG TPA: NHLP bacteriocin system secretion protein [Usitatibacter sp.]|nr:NHLP bacteriocin system secretion protein [Usitatibacter sp.]